MKVPPKEVIEAARELVEWYGPRFKYLGELEDQDVFMFGNDILVYTNS